MRRGFTKDLTGKRFGKLVVLSFSGIVEKSGKKRRYWNCLCECGKACTVQTDNLTSGDTNSCGCLFSIRSIEELKAWILANSEVQPNGCREWKGSRNKQGYGKIQYQGRTIGTHRAAAHAWHGLNLADRHQAACHHCDNPPCVEQSHIFVGSYSDNVRDSVRKGRQKEVKKTHCPKGHAYNESNTRYEKSGKRKCIECCKSRTRAYHSENRERLNARRRVGGTHHGIRNR